MIQLTNQTTVALLINLIKQNYGISWFADGDRAGYFVMGMHLPTGEIAYYVPDSYKDYTRGMIELPHSDLQDTSFETDAAERLLAWSQQS